MTRKSSKSIRAQRPSQAPPPRATIPPTGTVEPSLELAAIIAHLSPHGVSALVAYARKLRDEERVRGARPPLAILSPKDFVARVLHAALDATHGVIGSKVLIAPVYKLLEERGDTAGLALADFKDRLLTAHRAGLVMLSKCEPTERVDTNMLAASEIRHLGSQFHLMPRSRA